MTAVSDLHAGQPVLWSGPPLKDARLVALLLHGRGASAEDILGLANQFSTRDIAYVAPRAAGSTWYPYSFLAPIEQNEPWLGSALRTVAGLVEDAGRQGIPAERLVVMGFSQGAILTFHMLCAHADAIASIAPNSGNGCFGASGCPPCAISC